MKHFLSAAVALFLSCASVHAQWQTPNHSVPLGRGVGTTGFGSVGPCASGVPILGAGASTDPACGALSLSGAGVTGNLPVGNLNGGTNASVQTFWNGSGAWTIPAVGFGVNMFNGAIVPSNSGTALTLTVQTYAGNTPSATDPVWFIFRSATSGSGTPTVIQVTSALSVTVPVGSTMGFTANVPARLWLVAVNNAGVVSLAVVNCVSITGSPPTAISIFPLAGWGIASTITSTSGGANSAQMLYAAASAANVAYSTLGFGTYETGLAVPGTWNANPTRTELLRPGVPLPGATVQPVFLSTAANGSSPSIALSSAANIVKYSGSFVLTCSNASANVTFKRAAVVLLTQTVGISSAGASVQAPASAVVLDAPGTTASTTYSMTNSTCTAGAATNMIEEIMGSNDNGMPLRMVG